MNGICTMLYLSWKTTWVRVWAQFGHNLAKMTIILINKRKKDPVRKCLQSIENKMAEVHGNRTHLARLPANHNWI